MKALAVVVGISEDKAQLLAGQPTARVDTNRRPRQEELAAYLLELKAEYEEQTRFEAGNPPQKGLEGADSQAPGADPGVDPSPRVAARDVTSLVDVAEPAHANVNQEQDRPAAPVDGATDPTEADAAAGPGGEL
jgi:hypothetical protein